MSRFALPDLGEGLQEAEIVDWHVAEGDHIVADQPLVSVETEKAVVEIPSPRSGRILHLLAKLGDRVKVGAPLVEFEEGPHQDVGAVVGDLEAHSTPHVAPAKPLAMPPHEAGIRAAPAIRAFAASRGVELARINGSGPDGTITRDDVMRATTAQTGSARREPLRGVALSMSRNMSSAHQTVVPATLFDEADIHAWWASTTDVTARLIRAVAAGCGAAPGMNCWFDGIRMEREMKSRIDLGIAVDTEAGLIVPVMRDIAGRDAVSIRAALDTLKAAARTRKLEPAELRDATITLSNFGPLGGRHASLVVLPPQVAIVGAGRISLQATPGPAGPVFHPFLPLSVTFDHRVITGGETARFTRAMIDDLERPQ